MLVTPVISPMIDRENAGRPHPRSHFMMAVPVSCLYYMDWVGTLGKDTAFLGHARYHGIILGKEVLLK